VRQTHITFRLTALLAIGGLAVGDMAPTLAWAQPAPPPPPAGAAPPAGDPPGRVGSLSRISGTVSFHTADEAQWGAATLNYPVTSGNAFWTEPNAGADIDVGSTRLVLAPRTELDIATLDDHAMAATEAQGELYLRIRDLAQGDSFALTTPRATVTLSTQGRYDIVAGDTDHPTLVTVIEGAARIEGANISVQLTPHQTATITGTDAFQASVGAEADDPFLRAQLARERPPAPRTTGATPPPAIVAAMTGGDELDEVGEWSATPQYGTVWYPPVQRDWVPYRHGHWAYVAPWGWTWVDDASWGFAPSHYGRWVEVNDRWGWIPGSVPPPGGGVAVIDERPVYAPAMVSFVDVAAGAAVGVAAGLAIGAAVGWIPLGPREPYIPPYRVSERYLTRVNVTNVTNITTIANIRNNPPPVSQFANRGGATLVPAAAMAGSRPIAAQAQAFSPQALSAARPVERAPIAPTLATAGVTPGVARQLNLAPAPGAAAPARPAAPGPVVQPRPADFGHGPLRPVNAGPAPAALPGVPAAPVPPAPAPGRPGLSPGAAAIGGAALGGAAVLGGAALLNRPRPTPGGPVVPLQTARPGGLPPLAAPRPATPPVVPGAAPVAPVAPVAGAGAVPRPRVAPAPSPARPGAPAIPPAIPAPGGAASAPPLRPGAPAASAVTAAPARSPAPAVSAAPVRPAPPAPAAAPAAAPARPAPAAPSAPPSRPAPPVVNAAPARPAPPPVVQTPRPVPQAVAPPPRPAAPPAPPARPAAPPPPQPHVAAPPPPAPHPAARPAPRPGEPRQP
jgi:hypothetical protein